MLLNSFNILFRLPRRVNFLRRIADLIFWQWCSYIWKVSKERVVNGTVEFPRGLQLTFTGVTFGLGAEAFNNGGDQAKSFSEQQERGLYCDLSVRSRSRWTLTYVLFMINTKCKVLMESCRAKCGLKCRERGLRTWTLMKCLPSCVDQWEWASWSKQPSLYQNV